MKKILSLLLAIAMLATVSVISVSADQGLAELYVSAFGSDRNDGTAAAPLKTVAAAKEKLRTLKGSCTGAKVYVGEGIYPFDETMCFTAEDLPDTEFIGTGDVRFTGSYEIKGFTEEIVNGVRAFTADVAGNADFKSLFNGDKQLTQPRYPEKGYFTVKATDPENDLWTEQNAPWSLCYGQHTFFADKKDLGSGFKNQTDVVVRILHYWHDEMMTVEGIDLSTGRVSLSRPSTMLIRDIDRYYFENVFEALNEPGEWYLDKAQQKLYYIPEAGETPETTVLRASSLERLIDINGVNGISFTGIRFEQTDWNITDVKNSAWWSGWRSAVNIDAPQAAFDVKGVITVNNAENVHFTNCEFVNLGATAVKFVNNVKHSSVENCYFENIAATGIFIGCDNLDFNDPKTTADITIRNNEIYKYGRKFFCAIGIQITFCDTAYIENNEIHDGYYTGISDGWTWGYDYQLTRNINIKNNLIYNIGQGWLSDMGGIYTLGIQPGTVLSGNVIHNVAADPGEGGYGGWGIYLDEGSSEILVEKNLVFACGSDGYYLHYGKDNTVRNNIFALNANSQLRGALSSEGHKTADFTGNIVLTDENVPALSYAWKKGEYTFSDNILWNLAGTKKLFFIEKDYFDKAMSYETAKRKHFIAKNVIADPCFTDPANFDFTIPENSPVFALGFEGWDYSDAGTVKGSVIGCGRTGGATVYNDEVRAQTYSDAREYFSVFNNIINAIVRMFNSIFASFSISC